MELDRLLNQTLAYWLPSGTRDAYGRESFATAAELACRWEDKVEEFINEKGERELSAAIVYVDGTGVVPGVGARVYYSEHPFGPLAALSIAQEADPAQVSTAFVVRAVGNSPGVPGSAEKLAKLWLKA